MEPLLLGKQLIIKSDQKSLKLLGDQRVTEGIQHKLMLKLLELDFAIQYKKRKETIAVDAFSRKHSLMAMSVITPKWINKITHSYSSDHVSQMLQQYLITPRAPTSHYSLHNGILRYKGRTALGHDPALKEKIMQSLHASALGGHSGVRATYQRVKKMLRAL